MSNVITIHRGRTEKIGVSLNFDISNDDFSSHIRVGRSQESTKIAEWQISFLTDGKDGKLIFTLDDSVTKNIVQDRGYMDIKRISGGEPYEVFDTPLPVHFHDVVTS